ncbi:MAG: DNA adenine methylase [Planktothrix sp.]
MKKDSLLKSGLKIIGGKTRIRGILYKLFPEHSIYIEPFMGSGNVWVGKQPVAIEIVGDINHYVPNFFKSIKSSKYEFVSVLHKYINELFLQGENVIHAKQCFESWKHKLNTLENSDVESSVLFYLISKFAMNGIFRKNKKGLINSSFCSAIRGRGLYILLDRQGNYRSLDYEWIDAVARRIERSTIVNESYDKYEWDSYDENTFAYLDPPYRFKSIVNKKGCITTYNGTVFEDNEYLKIANIMKKSKCKIMLSINDDEFIKKTFSDFNIIQHDVHYCCSQTPNGRGIRSELIILNYSAPPRPIADRSNAAPNVL